jgi:flagellar biosynthetic protein FlhB
MSEEDNDDKQHEASQQKLDEARKRGELVKSAELTVAATYGGVMLAYTAFGSFTVSEFGSTAMVLLENADILSSQIFNGGSAVPGRVMTEVLFSISPMFVVPMVLVLLALLAQRAVVFASDKIEPKLSKINPVSNFKQKFGRNGLFEFGKSFAKMMMIAIFLGSYLSKKIAIAPNTQLLEPVTIIQILGELIIGFILILTIFSTALGVIDYLWQRSEFLRRNRMSRQEVIDEMKNSEGDPHIKAQRRQRAIAIATNAMMTEVPSADVIIVNPTHYSIALKWEKGQGRAPTCVAKGVDEVAKRIREIAQESGVPIHSDPPTARALYAAVEIGREIQPQHYKPVAAAIRFAEKMRMHARQLRPRK